MVSLSVFVIHFAVTGGWMEFSTGLCIGISVTPGVASTPTKSLVPLERSVDLLPGNFYT